MFSLSRFCGLLLLLFLSVVIHTSDAASDDGLKSFPCQSHDDCSFLGSSYECFNREYCIKSSIAGCLRNKHGLPSRVCNSNDSEEVIQMGLCRPPRNEEMEIRIYVFDWDSSIFQTWILQILLSELLDVPVSVETGAAHIDFSFYSQQEIGANGRVSYNSFTSIGRSLRHSYIYGDCRKAQKEILARYEPCAHFSPEVRSPISNGYVADGTVILNKAKHASDIVEPLEPAGGFGEQGLYVPKFTAERDPSLTIHFGLSGEENRKKLADRFLRPTKWSDYCVQVSPTQCAESDGVASRAPVGRTEGDRYFVPGVYTGYFRKTDKNDCDKNPLTCTGHVADYPCGLFTPVENQIFELNLMLEGDGEHGKFGYGLSDLAEIWNAANYTKSDVLLYWIKPTLLAQEYAGTDAEFTKVSFPPPSQTCIDARKDMQDAKCLPYKRESYGDPEAVCDDPPFQLQKAISTSLRKMLIDGVPEVIRSPSYAVLKAYTLPEMELSKLLEDLKGYDDPRLAVCDWVSNNMNTLEQFIPPTYPRVQEEMDQTVLLYISLCIGSFSALLVIWTSQKVYSNRKKNVIRFAQFEFLALMLVGSFLTAIGAIIGGLPRSSDEICVAEIWFVYLGYTLSLVPQIVKVAAINRLMSAARRYERLKLNLKHLYAVVSAVSILVVIYLILWTVLDYPLTRTHYTLTDSVTASGKTIVLTSYSCGSEMAFWEYIAFAWNGLLLVAGVVLAIQSRNVVREFNESHTLGILIYTNFVFFMFRGLTYYLERVVDPSIVLRYRSIIYALDVIGSLAVYFWPKLFLSEKNGNLNNRGSMSQGGGNYGGHSFDGSLDGSTHFFAMPKPKRPMFTSLPNNRFLRLLTSVSQVTFHPNEEDSVSFRKKDEDNEESSQESTKDDVDGVGADDPEDSYVRKLEITIVGLEKEVQSLRKRINRGNFHTVSTSVGADPPSPVSSSLDFEEKGRLKKKHGTVDSEQVGQEVSERPMNSSEELPSQMPFSSSSETVSQSDQMCSVSSTENVSSSIDQESTTSSMPALASYCSLSESGRSEVSFSDSDPLPTRSQVARSGIAPSRSDQESTGSSIPALSSYYSTSESLNDSHVSVSETESSLPILQSPTRAIGPTATPRGGVSSELPLNDHSSTSTVRPASALTIPRRRPSLPSLPNRESLLSEVSMCSISEQVEQC